MLLRVSESCHSQSLEERPKLSPSDEGKLVRKIKSNPGTTKAQDCTEPEIPESTVSVSTVKWSLNYLELRVCQPRKNPLLQIQHLQPGQLPT